MQFAITAAAIDNGSDRSLHAPSTSKTVLKSRRGLAMLRGVRMGNLEGFCTVVCCRPWVPVFLPLFFFFFFSYSISPLKNVENEIETLMTRTKKSKKRRGKGQRTKKKRIVTNFNTTLGSALLSIPQRKKKKVITLGILEND